MSIMKRKRWQKKIHQYLQNELIPLTSKNGTLENSMIYATVNPSMHKNIAGLDHLMGMPTHKTRLLSERQYNYWH